MDKMEWKQFNEYILSDQFLHRVFKNNVKIGDRSKDLEKMMGWIQKDVETRDFYNLMIRVSELASLQNQPLFSPYFYSFSKEIYQLSKRVDSGRNLREMAESILYFIQIYYPIFDIILANRRDDLKKGFNKIKDWPAFFEKVLVQVQKGA